MSGKTLRKNELVSKLSAETGLARRPAHKIVTSLLALVADHFVSGGDSVALHGFGSLKRHTRAAFTGVNPATGEALEIPERSSIHFKPSREFRRAING